MYYNQLFYSCKSTQLISQFCHVKYQQIYILERAQESSSLFQKNNIRWQKQGRHAHAHAHTCTAISLSVNKIVCPIKIGCTFLGHIHGVVMLYYPCEIYNMSHRSKNMSMKINGDSNL